MLGLSGRLDESFLLICKHIVLFWACVSRELSGASEKIGLLRNNEVGSLDILPM